MDEMLTIQPRSPVGAGSCFIIWAMAYFIPRKVPRVFTAWIRVRAFPPRHRGYQVVFSRTIVLSKASTDSSAIRCWPQKMPALLTILQRIGVSAVCSTTGNSFTHISNRPNSATAAATSASTCCGELTSVFLKIALPLLAITS